jgi:low temperature requirement protein LtrA
MLDLQQAGRAAEEEQEVTALELFFDLVFVFAITQVTTFLTRDPTWTGLVEAGAILMALWFAWSSYAWLGNTAARDDGLLRIVLFGAMGAMLVASLAVPHAFGRDALVFGVAFLVVRAVHILAYMLVSRGDPELRSVVIRLGGSILPASSLLVVAGAVPEPGRAICWAAALTVDYGGLALGGTEGWRVEPAHFSERHRLIVIIALGESIVAVGVGATSSGLGAGVIVAALLGLAAAAAAWWIYFDVVAIVAERKLREAPPPERARMARDSYTYMHLPMVAGIVIAAFGVKTTLAHVHSGLHGVAAAALCGGIAAYLVALSALRRRNIGGFNRQRLVAAALLVALAPGATQVPALAALALVTAILCGLVAYERLRYADVRARIRTS